MTITKRLRILLITMMLALVAVGTMGVVQMRTLAGHTTYLHMNIIPSVVEIDKLLDDVSGKMAAVRTSKTASNQFLHFGKNNNSKDLVHDLLHGDANEDTIPTGIKPFDEQSGGFMRGGLVTIGATSGGGKCTTLDTCIQLSTLVVELDDGSTIEGEPEHPVLCWRAGILKRIRLDQICEQDELELDPQVLLEHRADWT